MFAVINDLRDFAATLVVDWIGAVDAPVWWTARLGQRVGQESYLPERYTGNIRTYSCCRERELTTGPKDR